MGRKERGDRDEGWRKQERGDREEGWRKQESNGMGDKGTCREGDGEWMEGDKEMGMENSVLQTCAELVCSSLRRRRKGYLIDPRSSRRTLEEVIGRRHKEASSYLGGLQTQEGGDGDKDSILTGGGAGLG
ncbi:hypothetical protein NHX12_020748 [Muraenolepis orangiensis]|uniref:Uncharacterized protein n=1 Tax=Muraenolepis orangiensis TaxID=630683 RepID=A0A9Q0EU44_9TELE|nr:hypothetical protein NHX12_020748 [Muraenolepis orangiensis]